MTEDRKLNLVLPGNPRYQPNDLQKYFGYDRLYSTVAEVEIATMQTLGEIGVIPPAEMELLTADVIEQLENILTSEVDRLERIIKHDIRAWVMLAQKIVKEKLARWVHVPLTSYDALDTGRILQYKRAHSLAIKPAARTVVAIMRDKARQLADVRQIGRTHGQHALPITVGFWLGTILERIISNLKEMDRFNLMLEGKISGAVGAHNAQIGLKFAERCGQISFEERVLAKLDLKPAAISTQILLPERLAYYLFSCLMLSGAFGQLGRDCRQLMRSEIREIGEPFGSDQVGSSTMAHKRNPINFENLEGMFIKNKNEFGKVMDCLISEHQRDLVGSAPARDFPTILVNLQQQLNTLLRRTKPEAPTFLERISVDQKACHANLMMSVKVILAEPLYIALQMAGFRGDAHHFVNHELVRIARTKNITLIQVLEDLVELDDDDYPELRDTVERIPKEMRELFRSPENYTGDAKEKALRIADAADIYLAG